MSFFGKCLLGKSEMSDESEGVEGARENYSLGGV